MMEVTQKAYSSETDGGVVTEDTFVKPPKSEYSRNFLEEAVSHCLVCNCSISENTKNQYNVFSQLRSENSRITVFEKVGQILNRALASINLHSETICQRCVNLLTEHEEIEKKLEEIRSELTLKFSDTANVYKVADNDTNKSGICENTETVSGGSFARTKSEILTITEEGKIVDEYGKEKEAPINIPVTRTNKTKRAKSKSINPNRKRREFTCSVCGKSFRAFSHRVEHMLIHIGEKPWDCSECSKTFRTKSALKVHSMKHSGERPFVCQHCGKSFLDRYYFEEHCRMHSGEKPFMCSFCQRQFVRKKDLSIHLRSHTGDKPHACVLCSKTFAVKSRLERHRRVHSGERPHACEQCGKAFARYDDFKVHMRQHTGERPFQCGFCSKSFSNQSNCLAHVRTHTGATKTHICTHCGLKFDRRNKLERHMSECHSDAVQDSMLKLQPLQPVPVTAETFSLPQPLVHSELQGLTVTELQAVPYGQVAQLAWSDGSVGGTTTTYVNITSGTFVNIVN